MSNYPDAKARKKGRPRKWLTPMQDGDGNEKLVIESNGNIVEVNRNQLANSSAAPNSAIHSNNGTVSSFQQQPHQSGAHQDGNWHNYQPTPTASSSPSSASSGNNNNNSSSRSAASAPSAGGIFGFLKFGQKNQQANQSQQSPQAAASPMSPSYAENQQPAVAKKSIFNLFGPKQQVSTPAAVNNNNNNNNNSNHPPVPAIQIQQANPSVDYNNAAFKTGASRHVSMQHYPTSYNSSNSSGAGFFSASNQIAQQSPHLQPQHQLQPQPQQQSQLQPQHAVINKQPVAQQAQQAIPPMNAAQPQQNQSLHPQYGYPNNHNNGFTTSAFRSISAPAMSYQGFHKNVAPASPALQASPFNNNSNSRNQSPRFNIPDSINLQPPIVLDVKNDSSSSQQYTGGKMLPSISEMLRKGQLGDIDEVYEDDDDQDQDMDNNDDVEEISKITARADQFRQVQMQTAQQQQQQQQQQLYQQPHHQQHQQQHFNNNNMYNQHAHFNQQQPAAVYNNSYAPQQQQHAAYNQKMAPQPYQNVQQRYY